MGEPSKPRETTVADFHELMPLKINELREVDSEAHRNAFELACRDAKIQERQSLVMESSTMQANTIDLGDLFSIEEFVARHPRILTRATLRYQLRDRVHNGLSRAVIRVGKKLLISETRYQAWLSEQAAAQDAA
ncbi:hypothetical protein [Bradyrhizobium sp. USDA 4469]